MIDRNRHIHAVCEINSSKTISRLRLRNRKDSTQNQRLKLFLPVSRPEDDGDKSISILEKGQ
jgi:hypothetical protein